MSNVFAKLLEEGEKQHRQLHQQPVQPVVNEQVVFESREADSMTARQHDSTLSKQHDSKPSEQHVVTTARQHDSTENYLAAFLKVKATNKTTLRYPQSLMDELDEVIYQIKKIYGTALSKNEIFVLSLAYILHNFKTHATHSQIYKTLIEGQK